MSAIIERFHRRVLLLTCLCVMGGTDPLPACSCVPPPPPLESLLRADAVFGGTVIELRNIVGDPPGLGQRVAVTFQVGELFKGEMGSEVVIHTSRHGDSCGYPFDIEESYLVYAGLGGGEQLSTTICSRTRILSQAEDDLNELRLEPGAAVRWIQSRDHTGRPCLHLAGVKNQSVVIEASGDLGSWTAVREIPAAACYVAVGKEDPEEFASRYYRARIESGPAEGIYGQVMAFPGVCLKDPEEPGQCLNLPFPGGGSYDVREYSETPDQGFSNEIVASFTSNNGPHSKNLELGVEHVDDLGDSRVSDALWNQLQAAGIHLSHQVKVQVFMAERLWIIHDPLGLRSFVVTRENWTDEKLDHLLLTESGWFEVPLSPGRYCVWENSFCVAQVEVEAGKRSFALLQQFLP